MSVGTASGALVCDVTSVIILLIQTMGFYDVQIGKQWFFLPNQMLQDDAHVLKQWVFWKKYN